MGYPKNMKEYAKFMIGHIIEIKKMETDKEIKKKKIELVMD